MASSTLEDDEWCHVNADIDEDVEVEPFGVVDRGITLQELQQEQAAGFTASSDPLLLYQLSALALWNSLKRSVHLAQLETHRYIECQQNQRWQPHLLSKHVQLPAKPTNRQPRHFYWRRTKRCVSTSTINVSCWWLWRCCCCTPNTAHSHHVSSHTAAGEDLSSLFYRISRVNAWLMPWYPISENLWLYWM